MSILLKFSFVFLIMCLVYRNFVNSDDSHICRRRRKFVCCDGYVADKAASSERLVCKPECVPACANATCVSPNNCECSPGYEESEVEHTCQPVCSKKVAFSHCVSPEELVCAHGYDLANDTCQPICSKCTNTACVAPDICDDGWMTTERELSTYKPVTDCNSSCEDKECLTPDICRCYTEHEYIIEECLEMVHDEVFSSAQDDLTVNLTVYEPDFISNWTVNGTETAKSAGKSQNWIYTVLGLILLAILVFFIVLSVKYKHLCDARKTYNVEEIEASMCGRSIQK